MRNSSYQPLSKKKQGPIAGIVSFAEKVVAFPEKLSGVSVRDWRALDYSVLEPYLRRESKSNHTYKCFLKLSKQFHLQMNRQ